MKFCSDVAGKNLGPLAPPPLMLRKARDRLVVETPGCCEPQGLEAPSAGECASTEDYGCANSAA